VGSAKYSTCIEKISATLTGKIIKEIGIGNNLGITLISESSPTESLDDDE
jgi:hypothetical protein